jgi:hypothetical protein
MAIDSAKLLNRPSGSNTLSSKSLDNIATIATTVSSIATIMRGDLVLDRMRDKKRRQKAQQAKRDAKERAREEGLGGKIKKKAQDVAGNVSDWLMRLVKGVFLIGLVKLLPTIQEWIPAFTEFIDNFIKSVKWLFKTVVNMIEGAYKIYDGVREWIGKKFGEGALKKFDSLMGVLHKFLNAALSAVVALLSFKWLRKLIRNVIKGGKWLLKKALKASKWVFKKVVKPVAKAAIKKISQTAAGKVVKEVAKRSTVVVKKTAQVVGKKIGGLAARIFGKSAGAIVPGLKGALGPLSKFFARVPIIGPLIVGIFSVLSGEPGGKAIFRMVGAGLGEFLGGALAGALAVGTAGIGALVAPALVLLGGTIGTWLGGVLYDLIQGGGIGAMKKKLGELVKGIFEKILDIGDWMRGGFMKFIKTFLKETAMELPSGGLNIKRNAATAVANALGIFDWLKEIDYVEGDKVAKFPNLLQLYNPFKLFPILKKSFFPVKDAVAEGKKLSAEKKAKEEKEKKGDDKGVEKITDMLEKDNEPSLADKTAAKAEEIANTPKTLAEMGDNKPDSANGLDQHTSYEPGGEGEVAFVGGGDIPVDSKEQSIDDILEGSSEGNTTDEKLESAYAGQQ